MEGQAAQGRHRGPGSSAPLPASVPCRGVAFSAHAPSRALGTVPQVAPPAVAAAPTATCRQANECFEKSHRTMGHIAVLMQHDKIIQELVKKGAAVALLRRNTCCCVATRCTTLHHVAACCNRRAVRQGGQDGAHRAAPRSADAERQGRLRPRCDRAHICARTALATSAPGLRCSRRAAEASQTVYGGLCTLHAGCVFIIRTYVYLYLRLPYVFHIYIKSISTSTPVSIIYSYPYPHGRCRRAAEAHTQVVDPQLGAPRRRTVMGSPSPHVRHA